ncbi:MAG: hypothetical protein U0841_01445 [Chloroflexia bacterium]
MDELWTAFVVVDQVSGGKTLQALYDRAGDEPKRPLRRALATALRWLAAHLAPLPDTPPAAPPLTEVPTLL